MKGISEASNIFSSLRSNNIVVYFDPDVDGLISGLFVCLFLSSRGLEFEWYINDNREHGFLVSPDRWAGKDIIAVDFEIDRETVSRIVSSGSRILSMDHHENGSEFINIDNRGVVLNNQYPFERSNGRYLSGAGVVYEVLSALDPRFITKTNRALVGVSLLTDIRDIENSEAHSYLEDLYTHPYEGYIKYLYDRMGIQNYNFLSPRIDKSFINYTLSPKVNALLRFNKGEEAVKFILGGGYPLDTDYQAMQKRFISKCCSVAQVIEGKRVTFVRLNIYSFADWEQKVATNFIGVVASKYLSRGKNVICYLIDSISKKTLRASFRGLHQGISYRESLDKNMGIACVGHSMAFGIKNFYESKELFNAIDTLVGECESTGISNTNPNIVHSANLAMISLQQRKYYAQENEYRLSQNYYYIQYDGKNIKKTRESEKYTKYNIDNVEVISFDKDLTPQNGLILPTMSNGMVELYLSKRR